MASSVLASPPSSSSSSFVESATGAVQSVWPVMGGSRPLYVLSGGDFPSRIDGARNAIHDRRICRTSPPGRRRLQRSCLPAVSALRLCHFFVVKHTREGHGQRNLVPIGKLTSLFPPKRALAPLLPPLARGTRNSKTPPMCALSSGEEGSKEVYEGVYGSWMVDENDKREVFLYRAGIIACCLASTISSSATLFPDNDTLRSLLDPLFGLGAAGLGLSLLLIHVYVTEIKRFMQILWVTGCLGSLGLAINFAAPSGEPLALYVLHHPGGVWAIGPLFASLTALVFKEGLCYGKLEAGALVFVIPALLLGHLAGLDNGAKLLLLGTWVALFNIFAARKFTQPIKDDIGDKSIFMFKALPEEEKELFLAGLQVQQDKPGRS